MPAADSKPESRGLRKRNHIPLKSKNSMPARPDSLDNAVNVNKNEFAAGRSSDVVEFADKSIKTSSSIDGNENSVPNSPRHGIASFVAGSSSFQSETKSQTGVDQVVGSYAQLVVLGILALLTLHSVFVLTISPRMLQTVSTGDLREKSFWEITEIVWCSGWITAASTGLGAVPFYFIREVHENWLGMSNAIAAGMMISASLGLLFEAFIENDTTTQVGTSTAILVGFWGGVGFIKLSEHVIGDINHESFLDMKSMDARRICLIMAVMTVHSFSEGVAIGVSYHSQALGAFITTTLAIHNIPEGLALSIVLIPRGMSKTATTIWCVCSSIPQPMMAVPAYFFVDYFRVVVPIGLGFAAGAMGYVAVFELYVEAKETLSSTKAFTYTFLSGMFMAFLQAYIASS